MSLSIIFISLWLLVVFSNLPLLAKSKGKRIYGGETVDIKDYPYQVSINYNDGHFCGGSIISKNFIVTAAHCLEEKNPKSYRVRYGSHNSVKGGKLMEIDKMYLNPHYNNTMFDGDLAIIKLSGDLVYGEKCQPIRLARQSEDFADGTILEVSGWGYIDDNGDEELLRAVEIFKFNHADCIEEYYTTKVTPNMICVINPMKGPCYGDSGSPLVVERRILVGVVSWSGRCGSDVLPTVFTSVSVYRDWIRNITGV